MARAKKEKRTSKVGAPTRPKRIPWFWLFVGVILLAAGYIIWHQQTAPRFVLVEGKKDLLVLIRDEEEGTYRLKYEGRQPVQLQSLQVMLAGQVLHVDVKQVTLKRGEQAVTLEQPKGIMPAGVDFTLRPGDEFEISILFAGQTIGGNYLYGFKIGYAQAEHSDTYELILEYDYSVVVK